MSEWIKCYDVPAGVSSKETPYLYKYIQIFGYDVMSSKYGPPLGKFKTQEDVYKECIRKGKTWREILDYKGTPENVML